MKAIKEQVVSPDHVRAVLNYDPLTGEFVWRKNGKVAGCSHNMGYKNIRIGQHLFLSHRLAWAYVYGTWPEFQIDHINKDRADNRIANLRPCTNAQNAQNMGAHSDSNSPHVGVCRVSRPTSKPWLAQIGVNGRSVRIGQFATESEAVAARAAAKKKYHPFGCGATS